MDLHSIDSYLCPKDIHQVTDWGEDWSWIAGGTWLFSEPQPQIKTLVDIQSWGWDKIELINNPTPAHQGKLLAIGATCPLINLLQNSCLSKYASVEGFQAAISALSASLKVVNVATVGGNICLALSVGTLAPIMVALDASYEIWNRKEQSRIVAAKNFQTGSRQTILKSGELLRQVLIPIEHLNWQVDYQRFGNAASEPALAIVVGAYNQVAKHLRLVIGASIAAPELVEFNLEMQMNWNNFAFLENINFLEDAKASAVYRREITQVLIKRCLKNLGF